MSKYIQTTLNSKLYKKLRIISIQRDVPLLDLIRSIIEEWLETQPDLVEKEQDEHGSEEIRKED
jgi:hypothetical protein